MNKELIEFVTQLVSNENLLMHEPMKNHTTFRVGGEAEYFVKVPDVQAFCALIKRFSKEGIPFFVLGNGSNILVGDKGIPGFVLDTSAFLTDITVEGERITAQAGALLSKVANTAKAQALAGMEFASGIPGTIGGAIVMNAGAYDGEMAFVVESVTVVDANGQIKTLSNEEMQFGYRTSILKKEAYYVLSTVLKLQTGDRAQIEEKMADFAARRREKQPLEYPSAGSTFKRPEGHFAGKLIMDVGLRGFRIGGAQVSEKHCGFVINVGGSSAADIVDLMDEVRERVEKQFGVTLEPEVIRVGDF